MNANAATGRIGLWWLSALAVFVLGIAYIYQPFLLRDLISGWPSDTYIQIAILQSWSNCLSGYGSCLAPNYFYPSTTTLGLNDGYLISGALYHLFRLIGFDPFVSYELVYVAVRLVGFVAVILFCVRMLRLPMWAAILAGWLGLVSINLLNQVEHSQLDYAAFVPLGLLLLLWILGMAARLDDAPDSRLPRKIVMATLLLGVICAAWAITAFYSFFFFFFVTLLFLAVFAILRPRQAFDVARRLVRHPRIAVWMLSCAALTPLAVWLVYGGTLMKTGAHAWYTHYNPRLYDLFNVGPENLVWTPVLAPIYARLSGGPMGYSELAVGFPLLFLCCFVFATAYLVRLAWRTPAAPVHEDHAAIAIALGIAALLAVLLIVQFGSTGHTGWKLVWTILPGAKAIRVPSRFMIFVTPLICMVIAYVMAQIYRRVSARGHGPAAALVGLILLLTVEQYNTKPNFGLPRTELVYFGSIPPPPAACRAFYVTVPRQGPSGRMEIDQYYTHSVDAMVVAALMKIPTVNGMASFLPPGWNLIGPFEPDYKARVASYAKQNGITGLCELDLRAKRWTAG